MMEKERNRGIEFLRAEGVGKDILEGVSEFCKKYSGVEGSMDKNRISQPVFNYYGKEVWEKSIIAVLCGKNLLLAGQKATGKNILAENLAYIFRRPVYNVSFHVNSDAANLIGADTFKDGQVSFRPGPFCKCAQTGGFGILDEINMAKNEALSVLHSALDHRRVIEVPGYETIRIAEETRFIGTMNYGYAGTRRLNEALASRFVIISMPFIDEMDLIRLLLDRFPRLKKNYAEQIAALFYDIKDKADSAEISDSPLDLRGLIDAVELCQRGLDIVSALDMGIVNKSPDQYERDLVRDIVMGRFTDSVRRSDIFA